jgi:hypothetical protein
MGFFTMDYEAHRVKQSNISKFISLVKLLFPKKKKKCNKNNCTGLDYNRSGD